MKKLFLLAIMVTVIAVGCTKEKPIPASFVGKWFGGFDTDPLVWGIKMTIAEDGSITGYIQPPAGVNPFTVPLSGKVKANGSIAFTGYYFQNKNIYFKGNLKDSTGHGTYESTLFFGPPDSPKTWIIYK
jgi:hypothetical protein